MARTITTTSTVVGFTFAIHGRGGNVTSQAGQVVSAPLNGDGIRIDIQHLDPTGRPVRLPRVTPQTVKSQHRVGMTTPQRPVDQNLATVLARTYTGTPAQILAQMAAAYEALEYPATTVSAK